MAESDAMDVDQICLLNLSAWFLPGLSKVSGRLHLRQINSSALTVNSLKQLIIDEEKRRAAGQETVVSSVHDIDLLYNGNLLRNGENIVNLKPEAVVHVVKKSHIGEAYGFTPSKEEMVPEPEHLQEVSMALRTAFLSPTFLKTIEKLADPEMLHNLFAIAPQLETDLIGIAIIQTPQLIFQLSDRETLQRLANSRPWVIEALNHIAAAVHAEKASKPSRVPGNVTLSQLLNSAFDDGGDDDEDMEEEDEPEPSRTHSQPNLRPITREQLALALNAVPTQGGRGAAAASPAGFSNLFGIAGSRPTTAPPASSSGIPGAAPNFQLLLQNALRSVAQPSTGNENSAGEGVTGRETTAAQGGGSAPPLTGELVARVMQEAFSHLPPEDRARQFEQFRQLAQQVAAGNPPGGHAPVPTSTTSAGEYRQQLAQMRELGITDESLSISALRLCEGDVEAAAELIFSGWDGSGADGA